MRVVFIVVIFLGCVISSSIALRCYNCMTSRDGNCDDESQMQVKDCETSAEASNSLLAQPVCLKVVKDIRGFDHVTKSCAYSGSILNPCNQHLSAEHCSTCDTNLCNNSSKLFFKSWLLIAVAVIATSLHVFHEVF